MTNATHGNTAGQHPNERPACPPWCVHHYDGDEGTPDHSVFHYGEEREIAGCFVRLMRSDLLRTGVTGEVVVTLGQEPQSLTAA